MPETYETILYQRNSESRVACVTLNRPNKRNSLNATMLRELDSVMTVADEDDGVGCVVLRGAGDKAFCSGADLGGFSGGGEGVLGQYEARGMFPSLFLKMQSLSKPILAAINGHCVAGGFGLMMACDLAIAKSGVKLGTPEIARGLFPFMISTFILRNIPRRRALEVMFLGELFSSEQAAEWDIVNRTVPEEDFEKTVDAWSTKIASYSSGVLRLGKRALAQQEGMPLLGALAHLQGLLSVNVMMEDAAEGITAFFEKRDPVWKGR